MSPSVLASVAASSRRGSASIQAGNNATTARPPRRRALAIVSTTSAAGRGSRKVNSLKNVAFSSTTPATARAVRPARRRARD